MGRMGYAVGPRWQPVLGRQGGDVDGELHVSVRQV